MVRGVETAARFPIPVAELLRAFTAGVVDPICEVAKVKLDCELSPLRGLWRVGNDSITLWWLYRIFEKAQTDADCMASFDTFWHIQDEGLPSSAPQS